MTTGMVGKSGRLMSKVAPNSPKLIVKENAAQTNTARPKSGVSISHQTRVGDAPKVAAAWRRRGSRLRKAGRKVRMTKGAAMSVWAMGISSGEVRSDPIEMI